VWKRVSPAGLHRTHGQGLEFDRVLVPDASAATYHTEMDRNPLYVACTRAMHVLLLTHTAAPSTLRCGRTGNRRLDSVNHPGRHRRCFVTARAGSGVG
jgi:superfamily I DNA/RNA helicase